MSNESVSDARTSASLEPDSPVLDSLVSNSSASDSVA